MPTEKSYTTNYSVYGYNSETNSYDEYVSDTEYVEILREQSGQSETN